MPRPTPFDSVQIAVAVGSIAAVVLLVAAGVLLWNNGVAA